MKLSVPVTLGLAALATASPVAVVNNEVADPSAIGKRCFLWSLFLRKPKPCPPSQKPYHPKPKPCPPSQKPNPPKPKPTPSKTPCPTPSSTTKSTTSTTSTTSSTSSTTPPAPTPTGPETKREDQEDQEDNLAQLFNFIDAANEEDVNQFIHFYKNADKAEVEAWWSGEAVNSEFAPSFPASSVHEIAESDVQDAST